MAMDGLARKRKIRAGHRGSATRMLNQMDDLLSADVVDRPRVAQLRLSLEEKLETLKQLDGEILELTEDTNLEDEIQQADEFKDRIYFFMVKMDKMKSSPTAATTAAAAPTRHPDNRIKLPKLSIQPFDGDLTMWTPFWDSYDSAIHQNSSLTEIDKFNYLRSLLKGTAREAVSGLMLTTANYDEAVSILKKRFGKKQQIISRHMDILMNIEPVTQHNDLKALRHLYDVVESNVRGLKGLGVAADSYGTLLSSVLMNKLPNELRLIIGRKVGEGDWSLEVILKEFVQEIEARERTAATTSNPTAQPRRGQHTAATLLSSNSQPQCCFCSQHHPSEKCRVVKGVENRKQSLMKAGRCYLCLRRGHVGRDCRTRTRCSECGGRNHPSICYKLAGTGSETTQPVENSTEPPPGSLNPDARSFQPPTSTSLFVSAKGAVLLQTARMRIYDPQKPQKSVEVRAILDTGSQQSYASQRVKNALALKPHSKQTISIVTFGSDRKNAQTYDVVRVGVVTTDGKDQEIELLTVPSI